MRLSLCLLIAATMAGPAHAAPSTPVTIKPGDYKLEWQEHAPTSYRTFNTSKQFRKMDASEVERCPGLVSKDPRITDGPLRLILDESQGTGAGYDTLYYLPPSPNSDTLDFSKARKMALERSGSAPVVLKPLDFPDKLDWPVGEGPNRLIKKISFDYLQAIFVYTNDGDNRRATLGALTLAGGWFGRIDTDHGPMLAILTDGDGDGIYGEKVSVSPETNEVQVGDTIVLGDEESLLTVRSRSMHSLYPGPTVSYDGKLYSVTVSSSGETVSIKPYVGDTGRLTIEAVDGRGKQTECFGAYAKSPNSVYAVHGCFGSDLPVGTYGITRFLIGPDPLNELDGKFRFYQYRDCKITIEKGKTTTINLGGPITMDIKVDSNAKIPVVKRGQTLDMSVIPMIGKDRVEPTGDRPVSISVKDPSGRTVLTAASTPTFYDTNSRIFEYSLQVPREWRPGLYTLTATYSSKPYQDLITGTKLINVTQ